MAAATLLTDAFTQAVVYWRANAGGTRAGLIAHLQSTVSLTSVVAAKWVDAMILEAFNLAIIDDATYPSFKARLLEVGPTRALNGARCVFDNLREGVLILDAMAEEAAKQDTLIAGVDAELASLLTTTLAVTAQPPSAERDLLLSALSSYQSKLERRRASYVMVRDRALSV